LGSDCDDQRIIIPSSKNKVFSTSIQGVFDMISILLVDDQNLICQGLKAILDQVEDFQVVGTAANGALAIEQVEALHPDVVLMDVRMPEMNGVEATQIICQRFPDTKVLVLSTFDDDLYIASSMQAGAKGYLLKDMPTDELAQTIRLAYRGYAQMSPGLMEKLVGNITHATNTAQSLTESSNLTPVADALTQLTPREYEVLRLLKFGATNREIAEQLYISEGTVKTHVNHILNRLDLKNRSQLAIYANSVFKESASPPVAL
jgi:DNA-binding NarL/FixJ family response regulator